MTPFAALDVSLADDYITIGPVALVPRGSTVQEVTRLLGPPDRILTLSAANTVYIYDQFGIRFWAEAAIVGELQIVFETSAGATLPKHSFAGPIAYRRQVLNLPVPGSLLASGQLPGFVQDTDRLQYNMVVYEAKLPHLKYSAVVSPRTGNVQYISIS